MSEFKDDVFSTLKGFGYVLKMFDGEGKGPIASPNSAAYIQAEDRNDKKFNLMIRLPIDDSTTYPELVIYKSKDTSDKFTKLLATLKKVALSYGNTVTIREFGQSIQAKDLGYLPKAAKEEDKRQEMGESRNSFLSELDKKVNESMPSSVIKHKQKLANMSDAELGTHLKDKTEDQVRGMQRSHALKNDRYINAWKKEQSVNESAIYDKTGTTKSSYHVDPKAKKARVIIRHSKTVDENKFAARSKNVKALFVENFEGERRKVGSKSLMAARALANHVNHGGGLYDSIANNIMMLSEDIRSLKVLKRKYPVSEDEDNKQLHTALGNVVEGLTDLMKGLNTTKIYELAEHLAVNPPNLAFAETYYGGKLSEEFKESVPSLARGSVIFSKTRKFHNR